LPGGAFGENAQKIPHMRHYVGRAFVVMDTDRTKKGAIGETSSMADRLQAVLFFTNLSNTYQNYYRNVLIDFIIPF
jgi:hypothetical protein